MRKHQFILRICFTLAAMAPLAILSLPQPSSATLGPFEVCRSQEDYSSQSILNQGYDSTTFEYGFAPAVVGFGFRDTGTTPTNLVFTFVSEDNDDVYANVFNDTGSSVTLTGLQFISYLTQSDGDC
jgi:hypothetical protein